MAVPGLVLGVLAAISRRSTRTGRLPIRLEIGFNERLLLIGCALPIAVLLGVSYLVTPVFTPRYALVAAPPLYVLVGRGLSRISPRQLRLLVSGLLLLGMTVSVAGYHSAPQQDQWDEAVTTIESRADTDALVVVYDRIATRNVRYYLDRDLRVVGVVAPDSGTGLAPTSNATTRRYVSEHEEVWVIFTHVSPKQKRELSAVVGGTHRRRGCTDYVGLRLCRFERPPSVDAADHSRLAGRGVSATGR